MNPGNIISSPKGGRKALHGRYLYCWRGKRWGNRHRQGNICLWPSLTGMASYSSIPSPKSSGLTGGVTWKCCKKYLSTLQRSALTSKKDGCCTMITPSLMSQKRSRHSYRNTTLKWWCALLSVRTCRPVIFGCFPAWRLHCVDAGLRRIQDSELWNAVQTFLNAIPKADFQKIFLQHWEQQPWDCIASNGRYFEKQTHVTFDDSE